MQLMQQRQRTDDALSRALAEQQRGSAFLPFLVSSTKSHVCLFTFNSDEFHKSLTNLRSQLKRLDTATPMPKESPMDWLESERLAQQQQMSVLVFYELVVDILILLFPQ